jgi:hypothetical protein
MFYETGNRQQKGAYSTSGKERIVLMFSMARKERQLWQIFSWSQEDIWL